MQSIERLGDLGYYTYRENRIRMQDLCLDTIALPFSKNQRIFMTFKSMLFEYFSIPFSTCRVFEYHRKSLIQHCERSELRLHFEWTKVD